jgi:hypothetical protein
VLLVKSSERPQSPLRVADLVAGGTVDPCFPRFLAASGAQAYLAGPADHATFATAVRGGAMVGIPIEP